MRKFKHKTAGYIAEKLTTCEKYKLKISTSDIIPAWVIENSNDWEEIIEKNYERLLYKGNILYSVKRLSDGVEFKIGDLVNYAKKSNYGNWKINNFLVKDNSILARSENNLICEFIADLIHVKEPILITEDGYECTLDDRVFGVLPKANWQTDYYDEEGVLVSRLFNPEGKRWNPSSEWLWFKTKENAEKYIYENKPEFSRKQILDAIDICDSYYTTHSDNYFIKVSHLKRLLNL